MKKHAASNQKSSAADKSQVRNTEGAKMPTGKSSPRISEKEVQDAFKRSK